MKLIPSKSNFLFEDFSPVVLYLSDLIWLENALKGFGKGKIFRFTFSYKDSTYMDYSSSELIEERDKLGITELDNIGIKLTGFKIELSKSRNTIQVNLDDDPDKSNYYKIIGFLRDRQISYEQRIFLYDKNDDMINYYENNSERILKPEIDHKRLPVRVAQPQGVEIESQRIRNTNPMAVDINSIVVTPKIDNPPKFSIAGFLSRNKEWIELIAAIATIVGLIILVYQVFAK